MTNEIMKNEPKLLLETAKFRVVEEQLQIGNNSLRRQYVVHPGAVAMLPLLEGGKVCLIRNYRIAVGKTIIELPAGTIDPGEEPQATAQRELQEETGYVASSWQQLPSFFMSPGILNERMYLFVAEGLTPGSPQRELGEQIDNLIVEWSEAMAMVASGEIEDAKSLVGLLAWDNIRRSGGSRLTNQ